MVDVALHLFPLGLALAREAADAFVIHVVGNRCPAPLAVHPDDRGRVLDGQELQRLVDLAVAQVER